MSDTSENEKQTLSEARQFIEVLHGDMVRTAYIESEDSEQYFSQAEGLRTALNIIEQVEHDEWDSDRVEQALSDVGDDDDPAVDADALQDLSQHIRNGNITSKHPVLERAVVDKNSRGYWTLLKEMLGIA